jgi:hypothetical protein
MDEPNNLLAGIDPTTITNENMPMVMVAMLNQLMILCESVKNLETTQVKMNDSLLIFRISRCGWDWIKDADNLKAIALILIVFGVVDQAVRMISHYLAGYP